MEGGREWSPCPRLAQASATGWCFPGGVRAAGGNGEAGDHGRTGLHQGRCRVRVALLSHFSWDPWGAPGTCRWAAGSGHPGEAAAPPDPASALLPGSSMFRAPCMSQRRLALIFCVSILIVLLVALILLCEWGPGWASSGLKARDLGEGLGGQQRLGRPVQGRAPGKPRDSRRAGRDACPFSWAFLTSGGHWESRAAAWAPCALGIALRFPSPELALVGRAPPAAPRLALPGVQA